MRFFYTIIISGLVCSGCSSFEKKEFRELVDFQRTVESSITSEFISQKVKPFSDPIAKKVHFNEPIDEHECVENGISLIELHKDEYDFFSGEESSIILFEDDSIRPETSGFQTGLLNHSTIGIYFPQSVNQSKIELRMNYSCELGRSLAIHVVVDNPLLSERPEKR